MSNLSSMSAHAEAKTLKDRQYTRKDSGIPQTSEERRVQHEARKSSSRVKTARCDPHLLDWKSRFGLRAVNGCVLTDVRYKSGGLWRTRSAQTTIGDYSAT